MEQDKLKKVLDAILLSSETPLSVEKLLPYFSPEDVVNRNDVKLALQTLEEETQERGFELKEVASGYRYQTREDYKYWVSKHWKERTPRYSRAFLETLALIVYRQPITRAEIEEVRGVAVSSNIIKSLQERDWIRVVGHKEVPGRPAMLGTTRGFLDYFNLKSLNEMPALADIQDIDKLFPELDLPEPDSDDEPEEGAEIEVATDSVEQGLTEEQGSSGEY